MRYNYDIVAHAIPLPIYYVQEHAFMHCMRMITVPFTQALLEFWYYVRYAWILFGTVA